VSRSKGGGEAASQRRVSAQPERLVTIDALDLHDDIRFVATRGVHGHALTVRRVISRKLAGHQGVVSRLDSDVPGEISALIDTKHIPDPANTARPQLGLVTLSSGEDAREG
jgi:hypothetical protein